MVSPLLRIHMCNCPVCAQNTISLKIFTTSGSYNLSISLPQWSMNLGKRWCDVDIPLKDEHSRVSYSLLHVLADLWVNCHHIAKRNLPGDGGEMTNLWME